MRLPVEVAPAAHRQQPRTFRATRRQRLPHRRRKTVASSPSPPPRSARNWRSPFPSTGTPVARRSRAPCSPSCPRSARSGRSGSGYARTSIDRPAGTGEPARSPPPGGVPQGFHGADQHPGQGPARAGEGTRVGPPVQRGRARYAGHPHGPLAQAPRGQRGRADEDVEMRFEVTEAPGPRTPVEREPGTESDWRLGQRLVSAALRIPPDLGGPGLAQHPQLLGGGSVRSAA